MVKRAKTMAINKELYERYKAMKAAKSASESEQQPPKTGFAALNNSTPEQPAQENPPAQNSNQWSTTYSQNSQPVQMTLSQSTASTYNSPSEQTPIHTQAPQESVVPTYKEEQ